jgi:hypothetical protein
MKSRSCLLPILYQEIIYKDRLFSQITSMASKSDCFISIEIITLHGHYPIQLSCLFLPFACYIFICYSLYVSVCFGMDLSRRICLQARKSIFLIEIMNWEGFVITDRILPTFSTSIYQRIIHFSSFDEVVQ